jgi:hypothetical protein
MRWNCVGALLVVAAAAMACGGYDECDDTGDDDCPSGATVHPGTLTALASVTPSVTPVPSNTLPPPLFSPTWTGTPAPPRPTQEPSVVPSGILGIVLIGPQCPVVREGEDCPDAPYAARIEVFDSRGGLAAEIASGDDGLFRVNVPAGEYRLVARPLSDTPIPSPVEQTVVVTAGAITEVVVSMDSGIR